MSNEVIAQHKTLRFVTHFTLWFQHAIMNELFVETKKVSVSNIRKGKKSDKLIKIEYVSDHLLSI